MPTATFVSITCQTCGLDSTVPVDALLVSVVVDDPRGTTGCLGIDADAETPRQRDTAGTVAWTCDACADLSTAHLDWPALLTLVTAGATVLDDATPRRPAAAPRAPGGRRTADPRRPTRPARAPHHRHLVRPGHGRSAERRS